MRVAATGSWAPPSRLDAYSRVWTNSALQSHRNTSITKSQRPRAGIPSMRKPASREIISASVELCETDVCFLHIQLIGTNVCILNIHKSPPDVGFESSRSSAKSESWNNPHLHCCDIFSTTILPLFHMCDECKRSNATIVCHKLWSILYRISGTAVCFLHIQLIGTNVDFQKRTMFHLMQILNPQDLLQNRSLDTVPVCIVWQCFPHGNTVCIQIKRAKRMSQALVHYVIARASLITDHKISSLPMRAENRHFRTICEQTFDNSPTDPISASLNWWSARHRVATLKSCWVVLFASSQYRSTHFFAWRSIS